MIALVRTSGPLAGQRIEVTRELILGREAASVDVMIEDPNVSRRHLVVRPRGDAVELEDLGSHNGTLLDGVRLSGPVRVSRHAQVTLGATTLDLEVEPPPPPPAPAPPQRPEAAFEVGGVVAGRFELTAMLGKGGMSRVYEAVDLKYDRPAAVKVISDSLKMDFEFRRRFQREARAAERVTHPHVLPVWDHGEEAGLLYLAMPLCDTDLAGLLVRNGPLEPTRALEIAAQIAWALDWAHDRGVVHRDVKPENIFLVIGPSGDHAYLADFGLAKIRSDSTLTRAGQAAGLTPDYAAPEQWRAGIIGPAADQYALAATLHTCVAGRPPFHRRRGQALRDAHLEEAPPLLTEVASGVPDALAAAVFRGLAKDQRQRFATCGELVAAARVGPPVAPPPQAPPPEAPPTEASPPEAAVSLGRPGGGRRGRRLALAGVLVAAAAGAVVAVVLATGGGGGTTGATQPAAGSVKHLVVGADPLDLAAGPGGIWVANHGGGTLSRIAPRAGLVRQKAVPAVAEPLGVAVGDGRVWVAGPDGEVASIDPRSGAPLGRAKLRMQVDGIAAAFGALWTFNGTSGTVTRVDVSSGGVGRRRTVRVGEGTSDIAAGPGGVWVANSVSATLVQLEPATGAVAQTVQLRHAVMGIALGEGAVWAASPSEGRIVRVASGSRRAETFPVASASAEASVAAGDRAVFYVHHGDGSATRVDPATGRRIGRPTRLATRPGGAVVAAHALWVADRARGRLARLTF